MKRFDVINIGDDRPGIEVFTPQGRLQIDTQVGELRIAIIAPTTHKVTLRSLGKIGTGDTQVFDVWVQEAEE